MGTISRANPDVGYMTPNTFKNLGFTQNVWAGDTLYLSGIAPFSGGDPEFIVHGVGSMKEQLVYILDIMEKLLAAEGLAMANVVSLNVYATSAEEFFEVAPIIAATWGDDAPSQTLIGLKELAHPDQKIELTAIAYKTS
jgi:enamine deaminase RidA (YjgF/YER057c/UK114 family)